MEKDLAHSFNISLGGNVFDILKNIQKKISENVHEKRNYDPSPHLSILTKFMDAEKTDTYAKLLIQEFKNDKPWKLEFSHISPSQTKNYIFLFPTKESQEIILSLRKRAIAATIGVGSEESNGDFIKYLYEPHISLIKLDPSEIDPALKLININFDSLKMIVNKYEITRQDQIENGFSNFPVIGKINFSDIKKS